ncbi:MAG: hypothetical protein JWQ35_33 [Bacteriovoracaceae bacterium]|nr:hypothetical protein [Bacteriovoracaceae bacterium]
MWRLSVLFIFLIVSSVYADVIVCGSNKSSKFLIVKDAANYSAVIFSRTTDSWSGENWKPIYTNAEHIVTPDGGSMNVIRGKDESIIDWKNRQECFVVKKDTYAFRFKFEGPKLIGASLDLFPNIEINPNVRNCSTPDFPPPRPIELNCESKNFEEEANGKPSH